MRFDWIFNIITLTVAALLFTACNSDDEPIGKEAFTLSVPIEIVTSNMPVSESRTTGDPGIDDELPPPANIYAFSWVQISSGLWELFFTKREGLTASDWEYSLGTDNEDQESHYKLKTNLLINFTNSVIASAEGSQVGRTYVVATTKALANTELETMAGIYHDVVTSSTSIVYNSPDAAISSAELSTLGWTETQLRDFYSTPFAYNSGIITFSSSETARAKHSSIKLYHCAAKIDFTWEVDKALQAGTSVNNITVTNLPTTCKVFLPTANPTASSTAQTIYTTAATKWIGREYIYALQPSTGAITYNVSFNGTRPAINGRIFTPSSLNTTFTGWYRIVATIK